MSMKIQVKPSDEESLNSSTPITKGDLDELRRTLAAFSDSISSISEKLAEKTNEAPSTEKQTLYERINDNNLRDMFVGKDVVSEDVDSVVATLTLMNALIITIPYGLMGNLSKDFWDWVQTTLDACPTTKFKYSASFESFKNAFSSVIYSSIACLVMAMLYYLLRPKQVGKFRAWWKTARYVVIFLLCGTVTAVVSLIAISCWMFAWYVIPSNEYCDYSSQNQNIIGIAFVVVFNGLSLFLMA